MTRNGLRSNRSTRAPKTGGHRNRHGLRLRFRIAGLAIAALFLATGSPTRGSWAAEPPWTCTLHLGPLAEPTDSTDLALNGLTVGQAIRFILAGGDLRPVIVDPLDMPIVDGLDGVSAPEAIEILARRFDLDYQVDGDQLIIRRRISRSFQVAYSGDAESPLWTELKESLTPIIGSDGTVAISPRTGVVGVTGPPSLVDRVGRYLAGIEERLDRQVNIEARILEVSLDQDFAAGIDWTAFADGWDNISGNTNSGGLVELRALSGLGIFQMGLIRSDKLDLLIDLLDDRGRLRVVSRPRVAALGNEPAYFRMTENVPFYTIEVVTADGSQPYIQYEVDFREAGVVLEVQAQVGADDRVTLQVHPKISAVTGFTASLPNLPPQPIIDLRETETAVRLRQNESLVIGGMLETTKQSRVRGVPIISRIPLLGGLFRSTLKTEVTRELVVLLTPRLVVDPVRRALDRAGHSLPVAAEWDSGGLRVEFAAYEHDRALDAFAAGEVEVATRRIEKAIAFAPDRPILRLDHGLFLARAGHFDEALAEWDRLERSLPEAAAWTSVNRGALALLEGKQIGAFDSPLWDSTPGPAAGSNFERWPTDRAVEAARLCNRASALEAAGKTEQAATALEESLEAGLGNGAGPEIEALLRSQLRRLKDGGSSSAAVSSSQGGPDDGIRPPWEDGVALRSRLETEGSGTKSRAEGP